MARRKAASVIDPGPEDKSLLYLQQQHVSEAIWQGHPERIIHVRRCVHTEDFYPPEELMGYLQQAGFYGVACSSFFPINHALVSALVERWRPETHTFHMPMGECTITLQDVAIQMGLPVDGEPVVGRTDYDWFEICERYLGLRPHQSDVKGQRLSLKWLANNFRQIPKDATDQQLQQYARAYIMQLIGGMLFGDTSSKYVHLMYLPLLADLQQAGRYSWGSAVLAYLYRELCCSTDWERKEMGGCVHLLHVWAWDRFPLLAPRKRDRHFKRLSEEEEQSIYPLPPPLGFRWSDHRTSNESPMHLLGYYRSIIDRLSDTDVIWQPYMPNVCQDHIPDYCYVGRDIWQAHVPLICFHIIEWHQSDRVLRQFGMDQPIPNNPVNLDWQHTQQLKGKWEIDWSIEQQPFIAFWQARHNRVYKTKPLCTVLARNSDYMRWYKRCTRKWICPNVAALCQSADGYERIMEMMTWQPTPTDEVIKLCKEMLFALNEDYRTRPEARPHKAPPAISMTVPSGQEGRQRSRAAGFVKTRKPIPRLLDVNDDC